MSQMWLDLGIWNLWNLEGGNTLPTHSCSDATSMHCPDSFLVSPLCHSVYSISGCSKNYKKQKKSRCKPIQQETSPCTLSHLNTSRVLTLNSILNWSEPSTPGMRHPFSLTLWTLISPFGRHPHIASWELGWHFVSCSWNCVCD